MLRACDTSRLATSRKNTAVAPRLSQGHQAFSFFFFAGCARGRGREVGCGGGPSGAHTVLACWLTGSASRPVGPAGAGKSWPAGVMRGVCAGSQPAQAG
jgi:hypothetical protein